MILAPASAADAALLAAMHARSFDTPWKTRDIETLLVGPGGYAITARAANDVAAVRGFILARAIAGEAEILTLAVDPAHRRLGVARALVEAAALAAEAAGAEALFLEVAADNAPAIALYAQTGFQPVGRRAGYYARADGEAADALVLRRTLNRRAS